MSMGWKRRCKAESDMSRLVAFHATINGSLQSILHKPLQKLRVGHAFFSKESNALAVFCVLYKRMRHSLCSFAFFMKERGVLCVLLRSL